MLYYWICDDFLFLFLYEWAYKRMFFFSVQVTCCSFQFEWIFVAQLLICWKYCKVPGVICVRAFNTVTVLTRREKSGISNFSAKHRIWLLGITGQMSNWQTVKHKNFILHSIAAKILWFCVSQYLTCRNFFLIFNDKLFHYFKQHFWLVLSWEEKIKKPMIDKTWHAFMLMPSVALLFNSN